MNPSLKKNIYKSLSESQLEKNIFKSLTESQLEKTYTRA
jgi:hypothetical protein